MAAKDDPVIDLVEEEEEEEWPEVGVQNPEEAEHYTEKINNVFDHLSTNSSGHEDGIVTNNSKFQKDCSTAVGEHGGCRCRRRPQVH